MTSASYRSEELVVHWDATRCIHTAICLKSLPAVFEAGRRPWIRLDAASTEEVIATVKACPTGALRYERADGSTEPRPQQTTMTAIPGGPLIVRGDLRLLDGQGNVVAEETRLALCRCGGSQNQPFCDNSHRRVGRSEHRGGSPERARAASPEEVCPPQPFEVRQPGPGRGQGSRSG